PPQAPPQPEPVKPVEKPLAKPAVVDLRNAAAAQRAEALSVEKKEDLIRSQKEKIDKLTMIDGNIFYGVAYRENQDSVWLFTVLGNLELKKADIRAREKVSGSAAIK
ncbi:MAG TPA: hypothetical protein PKM44_16195, partial [Turneriella sp.]|nr:hypothetical protein [Turneriella sp.]